MTEELVPHLAASFALLLAVFSVFALIAFLDHIAKSLQAPNVIFAVAKEVEEQLPHLFPETEDSRTFEEETPFSEELATFRQQIEEHGIPLLSPCDGFIRLIAKDALLDLATEHGLQVWLYCKPGDFVYAGVALASLHSLQESLEEEALEKLLPKLEEQFVLGEERSAIQDLQYLTDQLTEIAARGLSPGINDPRTACHCAERLGAIVSACADRKMPSSAIHDKEGQLRLFLPTQAFEDIMGRCFDPLRQYGAGHVEVVLSVLGAFRNIGTRCRNPGRRRILLEHTLALEEAFRAAKQPSSRDRLALEKACQETRRQLERPHPSRQVRGHSGGSEALVAQKQTL